MAQPLLAVELHWGMCSYGLIKRDFSGYVAKLTGAYSLTMGAAAAIGSTLVVPLALHGFGWRGALLMLMFFR